MRITTIVLLGVVLVCGYGYADRSTFDPTRTQMALPMPEAPTIDGIIDTAGGEWTYAGGAAQGGNDSYWRVRVNDLIEDFVQGGSAGDVDNAPIDDIDLSFDIFVGYDSQNLYVAVRVSDDWIEIDSAAPGSEANTWLDDSVEVFVDGDNSNFDGRDTTGTNPDIVNTGGQYVITAANIYRDDEAGSPGFGPNAAWHAVATESDNGYEAEFRISMDIIGNPQRGDIIGFNIAVNDDDDGGNNDRQVVWTGAVHNEITYGNLVLGPYEYRAPRATAPTVDGAIAPGEYDGAPEISVDTFTAMYDIQSGDDTWEVGDHAYSAWVVHDDQAVYVGVDVIDDIVSTNSADPGSEDGNTWIDDSVEIFFDVDDSNNSGPGSAVGEGQYVLTANGAHRDNEANNPTFGAAADWFAATTRTTAGYQIEFKVNKSVLQNPADGALLGFNLTVNDDDGADRESQPMWQGRAHNELSYADLILLGGAPVGEWSIY